LELAGAVPRLRFPHGLLLAMKPGGILSMVVILSVEPAGASQAKEDIDLDWKTTS
jgi:hypothetical protein